MNIRQILRDWTLLISMIIGVLIYAFIKNICPSYQVEIYQAIGFVQPILIFAMLFLAFSKLNIRDFIPRVWHIWLLLWQGLLFLIPSFVLWKWGNELNAESPYIKLYIEAGMLSIICPTATAAAIVTSKLGGNAAHVLSYTILINILVAIIVPLCVPMIEPNANGTFFTYFCSILNRVFPMLIGPLIIAQAIKYLLPKLNNQIIKPKNLTFNIWLVSLSLAITVGVKYMFESSLSYIHLIGFALVTFGICFFKFFCGKKIGSVYGENLEAGQALGQKNTVFAIWLGATYFEPVLASVGAFYSVSHNLINAWQLKNYRKTHENDDQ